MDASGATATTLIPLTRGAAVRWAREMLAAAGIESPREEADALLSAAVGGPRYASYLDPGAAVSEDEHARFVAMARRRAQREPIQYVIGRETFCGLDLAVTPDVLIPRPETEGVVAAALDALGGRERPTVADVGTGSGAIALAVASARPDAVVYAVDRAARALEVARRNARGLGLSDRVRFVEGDWFAPLIALGVRVDVLASNPPYVADAEYERLQPEVRFEPAQALLGGPDGLGFYRRIVSEAGSVLAPGGRVVSELGFGQADAVRTLAERAGFAVERVDDDANGIARVMTLARPTTWT
ncbi:MAG: peptide chain release factor N(5)-glutamine methyltransferase [Nitrospirota bacterium]